MIVNTSKTSGFFFMYVCSQANFGGSDLKNTYLISDIITKQVGRVGTGLL